MVFVDLVELAGFCRSSLQNKNKNQSFASGRGLVGGELGGAMR